MLFTDEDDDDDAVIRMGGKIYSEGGERTFNFGQCVATK